LVTQNLKMKQRAFTVRLSEYESLEELPDTSVKLVKLAMDAAGMAYAPYSGYHVGAAAQLSNGEIVTGNNQENASYPMGLCAERVAIFHAGSRNPGIPVTSLAIAAMVNGRFQEHPVAPCGGCRQVLYEKERVGEAPMELILFGTRRIQVLRSAKDLLPIPFNFQV
jgi:cytidine deaminase